MAHQSEVFGFDPTGHYLHEVNAELRESGPAVRVELPEGLTAWSVTRYELLKRLTEDPRVSRDAVRHWPELGSVSETWPLNGFLVSPSVLNAYGKDHQRLRQIMEPALAPDRLAVLESNVRKRVPVLLDALGPSGTGEVVDIRSEYALVLAGETLCDLFGVPQELWGRTRTAMGAITDPSPDPAEAAAATGEALGFLGELLAAKRRMPGDDMMSTLLATVDMTDEERLLALVVTVAGGLPSTTDLIANAVLELLSHPDQLWAVQGGQVPWADVVEETLRVAAPVQHMPLRYAVEDIDLGENTVIRRGEAIIMGFGAGGRDPRLHGSTAIRFEVERPSKEHLAFGHGVHRCIGAPLGRLQATIALPVLFERFPSLRLATPAAELTPLPTFIFHGKVATPVWL